MHMKRVIKKNIVYESKSKETLIYTIEIKNVAISSWNSQNSQMSMNLKFTHIMFTKPLR